MFCHLYCFAAATQGKFFLFQNSNIYIIKIGIRIRDPESESGLQKICTRIHRFFGRIAIPDLNRPEQAALWTSSSIFDVGVWSHSEH